MEVVGPRSSAESACGRGGTGAAGRAMPLRRAAAALLCAAACGATVCVLRCGAQQGGAPLALAERECGMGRDCGMSRLDARLEKILDAEHRAAGAIDVLWRESNEEPVARPYRSRGIRTPPWDGDASWSARMAQYLERLNELTVPEAAAVAPTNLELGLYQDGAPPQRAPALADAHAPAPRAAPRRASASPRRQSAPAAPVPKAAAATVSAVQAAAAARVQKVLGSVKKQEAGTQQLVAEPRASFFQDAVNNLAAAKKPARSHLQARTMMLADAAPPTDNAEEQAADTQMAIEDAVADGNEASEQQLGDTLQGHWHAPMWPGGSDEGSPVLTGTIAAPGQGGEYAYGFPYDEAKLFSLAGGGNASNASATDGGGADGDDGLGDVVEAAEDEAKDEGGAGAQQAATPFYQGVGAGAQLGPASQGGWNGNPLPPAMPDDAEREQWLQTRANGYADEFGSAARAVTHTDRERAMARENAQEEQTDGEVGAQEDSHISQLRANIAKFVGAFDTGGAAPPQGGEAGGAVKASEDGGAATAAQGDHALRSVQSQKLARIAANKVAQRTAKLAGGGMSDREFLAKFKPPTVDQGEDFPCGWPGPPCADPATGVWRACACARVRLRGSRGLVCACAWDAGVLLPGSSGGEKQ
jgi:hypothetical protein